MQVREIMTPGPIRTQADETIAQAAAQMKDHNIGLLPVMSGGKIVGVVSDRDLAVRGLAAGLEPRAARVRQVMTYGPIWCQATDDVEAAARLMRQKKVRRLLVADEQGQPVGVLSVGDLAANAQSSQQACGVLADVCADLRDQRSRR